MLFSRPSLASWTKKPERFGSFPARERTTRSSSRGGTKGATSSTFGSTGSEEGHVAELARVLGLDGGAGQTSHEVCYRNNTSAVRHTLRSRTRESSGDDRRRRPDFSRSLLQTEEHLLGRAAQQPVAVAVAQAVEPVANEADRVGVGVPFLHLVGTIGGPHQPLETKRVEHTPNRGNQVVVGRLLGPQGVEGRELHVRLAMA